MMPINYIREATVPVSSYSNYTPAKHHQVAENRQTSKALERNLKAEGAFVRSVKGRVFKCTGKQKRG